MEEGRHYPSDVLVGCALGHFLSSSFNDAFLGLKQNEGPQLSVAPSGNSLIVGIRFVY
jgi:hypothetical protein